MAGEYTQPDLVYDLHLFKPENAMLVKVGGAAFPVSPDDFYENLPADELREVRAPRSSFLIENREFF